MDLTYPGQIAVFKVFPGKRLTPLYWEVLVFANKGYMRRAYRQLDPADGDLRFSAIVIPDTFKKYVNGKYRSMDNCLGLVLFSATALGAGTECHEAVHMALGYFRRCRNVPRLTRKRIDPEEETLSYHVGWCAAQLNSNFYRLKCYRK